MVPVDFMSDQREVTSAMRSVLVDWLIQVQQRFKLLQETLYVTVSIIDRFLSVCSCLCLLYNAFALRTCACVYVCVCVCDCIDYSYMLSRLIGMALYQPFHCQLTTGGDKALPARHQLTCTPPARALFTFS